MRNAVVFAVMSLAVVCGLWVSPAGADGVLVAPVVVTDRTDGLVAGELLRFGAATFGSSGSVLVEVFSGGCDTVPVEVFNGIAADGVAQVWVGETVLTAGPLAARATLTANETSVAGECVDVGLVDTSGVFNAEIRDGRVEVTGGRSGTATAVVVEACDSSRSSLASVSWTHDGAVTRSPLLNAAGAAVRVSVDGVSVCAAVPVTAVSSGSGVSVPLTGVGAADVLAGEVVVPSTVVAVDSPGDLPSLITPNTSPLAAATSTTTQPSGVAPVSTSSTSSASSTSSGSSGSVVSVGGGDGLASTGSGVGWLVWLAGCVSVAGVGVWCLSASRRRRVEEIEV